MTGGVQVTNDGRVSERMKNYNDFWENKKFAKDQSVDTRVENYTEVVNGTFLTFLRTSRFVDMVAFSEQVTTMVQRRCTNMAGASPSISLDSMSENPVNNLYAFSSQL